MGLEKLPVVFVQNLGKMCFKKALDVQKTASKQILKKLASKDFESIENCLFLVEHEPVYTVGIRNKQYVKDEEKLKTFGADFLVTDRGGLITFHGPGQLVAYPVIYLGQFNVNKSMKLYVKQLENTIIGICHNFGLTATTTSDVGVWINDRKIAAIGIHGTRYVTSHGIALNCNVDLNWFSHIVPCGLEGKEVTSLSKELQRDVTIKETIPLFLDSFKKHFACNLQYKDT
ncbi:putative lipoyltransferase 2, mitochondrial [Argiope bruennichi]|uniref:Octanoyl-[acyl-carrier-protein]:protein N-octanoyltransferase LIPT2, mitochondrial n=1 Tax=Argiope bruennichi TaxID=94029 RepID=A0A8T0FL27_ARGBR|nr:putative lipoyltransferase 2, mitochondrial [Argiope bruennichi]KAF8791904.1 putative lipoyltransferase 2 like protein [Argiope bruennichi]